MKKLLLSITLMLSVAFAFGQELSKEELKAQKKLKKTLMAQVKEADNMILDNPSGALNTIKAATESELMQNEKDMWFVAAKAKKAIIEAENNKNLQQQNFDANKLYGTAYSIFDDLNRCYTLDNQPDKKGKIAPKYTEMITAMMAECCYVLYNGGIYYYSQKNPAEAGKYFAKFVDIADYAPIKDFMSADKNVKATVDAAFNTTMCGMMTENYDLVLNYIDNIKNDSARVEYYYDYKTRALSAKGDTVAWLETLKNAVFACPSNEYFQNSLIQYYNERNEYSTLMSLMDEMIAANPQNPLYYYVKGYIFHHNNELDNAIEWYKKAIEIKPDYVEALANQGLCYNKKAQDYSNSQASTKLDRAKLKKDKEILNGLYNQALPLYEKVRELAPDKKSLWVSGLAICYSNLNMDDKFKEIEALLEYE